MTEEISIDPKLSKEESYKSLIPQLDALLAGETDLIANLANLSAALMAAFNFLWVGFYFHKHGELILGPFQGPVACNRLQLGKGVCGTAVLIKKTIIVPDVNLFDGHIACSSLAKSEIVIPIFSNGEVRAVLDVDSEQLDYFDDVDKSYLSDIVNLIESKI